jgi:prolyl oligopeptidase PreP (S9A serine peptidase family)
LDDKGDKENQTEDFTAVIYELLEEVYTKLEQVGFFI